MNGTILNERKIKCKKKTYDFQRHLRRSRRARHHAPWRHVFNFPASRQVENLPPIITHHYVHGAQVVQSCGVVKLVLVDRAAHHSPFWAMRPTRSALPSPVKSPTWTSTQVTAVLHWSQTVKLNELPSLSPVHHRPVCSTRPVISALPSPLKSPTLTSTQVTLVGQAVPQGEEVKAVLPLESATHHRPVCSTRPVISALPSPLKSPTLTSTQVTAVLQAVPQREDVKAVLPLESPTHQ